MAKKTQRVSNVTMTTRKNKIGTTEVGTPTVKYSGGGSKGRKNMTPPAIVDK